MNEELKIIIKAEVDKFKKATEDAKKQAKSFAEQVKDAGKDVDETFKKAGASIANGMKKAAVGIAAASTALLALGASTKDYRNEQAKLVTSFEAAGGSAETAKQAYNDLYRVLGDSGQATEAAAHLAQMTTNQQELSQWTNICQGVYATFGDSLPIEGLTEAANETAKVGTVTGSLADALNWAGISEDAFNESLAACNTEAEREKLIRETLNGLYDDAATKYEKNNADVLAQNEAQAQLDATLAQLGATVAPIITLLTQLASEVLATLTPYIQDFANNLLPIILDLIGGVATVLGNILGFLLEHQAVLITLVTIIGTVCTAIGIYNAVTAIKAAMDAAQVTTVWGLVSAHIAQAAAAMAAIAPYILIVAAIAAVIAIIVLCIQYWDEIVAAVKNAIKAIGDILGKVGTWIYDNVIKPVADFFSGMWDGLVNGAKAAWDGIKSVFSAVADFFKNIFTAAWEGVKAVFSVGGKIFDGIKDGIVKGFTTIVNGIITGINKVVAIPFNGINAVLDGIRSVNILGLKPFDWVGRLPVPQIPLLARGGILERPTLVGAGEAGAEAIVPLENNLGWLDKMAAMLNERMGNKGGAPIYLQVDGKTFAQIAVNSINDLTRVRGSLPLVMA